MPSYLLTCRDKPSSGELRAATRPEHLAFMKEADVEVLLAGPILNDAGEPIGSLIIVDAETRQAAEDFAAADPYSKAGLFQSVLVEPYRVVTGTFAASANN